MNIYGGQTGCSSPVASTSNQLTLCNHWIQHTSVHCNKAHIGHPLVKSFSGADVIQQPFSTGKLFNVSEEPVSDLQSLSALLQRLENDPTHTVIRGSLMEGQSSLVPRKMEFFTVTPRQWCMIDIDSLAWEGDLSDQQAMLSYASQQLPAEFQATDCWYHLSSSMLGGFVRRRNIHACGLAQISFPSWYFRAIMCLV